jgi:ATP phosphoribosyltransferase
MQDGVVALLKDAGIRIAGQDRGYRPTISLENVEVKVLKPQNIIQMLHAGSRDFGFAGADWVIEHKANVVELLDTGLDPVSLVAAAPNALLDNGRLPNQPLVVASEYEQLTKSWIADRGLNASFVHSYGATEVFPPEDADCIVDNTATGSTLRANDLSIVDELMRSSTRLYANPKALDNPSIRNRLESFVLLIQSVLEARCRVMVELNVTEDALDRVVGILPCMREVTVAELRGKAGYALRSAVPRKELPELIPKIKAAGGTDIVVSPLTQIVP